MARGQKRKTITTRAPCGIGTRKSGRSGKRCDENTPPEGSPVISHHPRPKPVPKKAPGLQTATQTRNKVTDEDTFAAQALVSLKDVQTAPAEPRSESLMDRCFRAALNLPPDTNLDASDHESNNGSSEEEEDQLQDDTDTEVVEVDELESDTEDHDANFGDINLLSDGEPRHKLPEFKIPIEDPYRLASRDVDGITSKTPFLQVLSQIMMQMGVSVSHLSGIGYLASYIPKSSKPLPKLLEDENSWFKLLDDIYAFILACKGKNGKGAVKRYSIMIVDTTTPAEDDKKKKKTSSAPAAPPAPALTPKESEQFVAHKRLEKRYACQHHKRPCYVQPDGEHYHLTMNDLTKWAHLMAENKALLDTPPEELKLVDAIPRQLSVKKTNPATPTTTTDGNPLPEWIQQLMGVVLLGNIASNNCAGVTPLIRTGTAPQMVVQQTPSSPLVSVSQRKRPLPPLDYPLLDDWLKSLKSNPRRSKKSEGYALFAESFADNGIDDLEDLLRLTNSEILNIVPNINIGIANRLLAFAKEDLSSLQPQKRIQVEEIRY